MTAGTADTGAQCKGISMITLRTQNSPFINLRLYPRQKREMPATEILMWINRLLSVYILSWGEASDCSSSSQKHSISSSPWQDQCPNHTHNNQTTPSPTLQCYLLHSTRLALGTTTTHPHRKLASRVGCHNTHQLYTRAMIAIDSQGRPAPLLVRSRSLILLDS